jgi:uncharacterized protein (TIGR00730 family)
VTNNTSDKAFYAGPTSRFRELRFVWRVFVEFIRGFRALHFSGPCVTVFGSARFPEGHPYYALAGKVGAAVANLGFTVMTGGGPGIMEAANRGAKEAGGASIGCNIHLPAEQEPNAYLDSYVTLDHFFVRKVLLFKYSYAFVILPGGFGTMDEFFEVLTLVQTGKIQDFPLIVMGQEYFAKLRELLENMLREGTINAEDMKYLHYTDSVEDMAAYIASTVQKFGVIPRPSPSWILHESGLRRKPAKAETKVGQGSP